MSSPRWAAVCVVLMGILLVSGSTPAQAPQTPPENTQEAPATRGTESTEPEGDVIVFRNGRRLTGFQVVHRTSTAVVVRLTEGLEMTLPMGQIAHIEMDDRSPPPARTREETDANADMPLHGEKLAPELDQRLRQPLSSDPIVLEDRDFVEVLEEFGARAEVPLHIAEAVREWPEQERTWATEIPAGTSLFSILHDKLLRDFPALAVRYHYDRIEVGIRAAANGETAPAPPSAAPGQ